jgi:excisionase family DNA binding protein
MNDRLESAVRELASALLEELSTRPRPDVPDRLLSVVEVAESLGIGRSSVYAEIQSGRLRTVLVGRRRLCPSSAVSEFIQQKAGEASTTPALDGGRHRHADRRRPAA